MKIDLNKHLDVRIVLFTLFTMLVMTSMSIAYSYKEYRKCKAAFVDTETLNVLLQQQLKETKETLRIYQEPMEYISNRVTIYETLPLDAELQRYTYEICVTYGIEDYYELALAVMWKESHFMPDKISTTNDYGIMQINKQMHNWLKTNIGITDFLDAKQSIKAGVFIIASLSTKYKDVNKVLMSYNLGEPKAKRYWARGIYKTTYCKAVLYREGLVLQDTYHNEI